MQHFVVYLLYFCNFLYLLKIYEKYSNSCSESIFLYSMSKFTNYIRKLLIITLFPGLLLSCAKMQEWSGGDQEEYSSQRQKVMTERIERKDINLPEGSTILDDNSTLNIGGLFGGNNSVDYKVDSIIFDVALDKVSFMPLASVDSIAGIIVTDWYSLDSGKNRIKINIRIIDQELTDQSLNVSLFTQSLQEGLWVDKGINAEQGLKIKNSILSTARSLQIASEL